MAARRKRPGRSDPRPESPVDEDGNPIWAGPSRSQVRREAARVSDLGVEMVKLPASRLARLDLDEELHEAVTLAARLVKNARARQLRLVAKLLRDLPAERLAELSAAVEGPPPADPNDRLYERWRTRLLTEGDTALDAFVGEYPEGDRTALRQLMRAGTRTPPDARTARAQKQLYRAIRDAVNATASESLDDADDVEPGEFL